MRLIDADAYAAEMRERQEICRAWKDSLDRGNETYARAEQSYITFVEAALTLKNQPTIDAIPIEWMASWVKRHPDDLRCVWFASLEMEWRKEQEARA